MLPEIDLPRALLRGRYMAAVAAMEHNGTPIDVETLDALRANWGRLKGRLTRAIDSDYGVFVAGGRYRTNGKTLFGKEILAIAAEVGCHPYYVGQAARHVHASRVEFVREIREAEQAARRKTGLTVGAVARWENAGRDHSTWPALDVLARELAGEYPALGIGSGYSTEDGYDDTDHAALLWDRLREPTEKLPKQTDPEILSETAYQVSDAPADLPDDAPDEFLGGAVCQLVDCCRYPVA